MSFSNLPQIVQPSSDLRCGSAEWTPVTKLLSLKLHIRLRQNNFVMLIYRRHSNLGSWAERLQGLLMQVHESERKCWIPALHGTTMKPWLHALKMLNRMTWCCLVQPKRCLVTVLLVPCSATRAGISYHRKGVGETSASVQIELLLIGC